MLGQHVVHVFRAQYPDLDIVPQRAERFTTSNAIEDFLSAHNASTVVNCIGYLGSDTTLHYLINGCLPRAIADWCDSHRALCIHISTNAVFAPSDQRFWLPTDQPAPNTPYEISKLFGEDPRSYVIRASFIGRNPKGLGLYEKLLHNQAYIDRKWNGVSALHLAARIAKIVKERNGIPTGKIEHVHSLQAICFRDIAELLSSDSPVNANAYDARLLGGGEELRPFVEQFHEYRTWLDQYSIE